MALAWGLFTGHWEISLGVGVFFELLWLDLIPAGTFIPPNTCLATFVALALCNDAGALRPAAAVIPMLLSIPAALLGGRVEQMQRRWQDAGYNEMVHWARQPQEHAGALTLEKIVLLSLVQQMLANWLLFCALLVVLAPLNRFLLHAYDPASAGLPLAWGHVWLLAAMGGLIALRLRNAYGLLVAAVAVMAGLYIVPMGQ